MQLMILWIFLFMSGTFASTRLHTIYEWKYIDYLWKSSEQKDDYIRTGNYNYTKSLPVDVDRARDGRVFITIIRGTGVPASLNTISDVMGPSGPLLVPYPNWTWHTKGDCNGITSVHRIAIDECNRLWVLDTGYYNGKFMCLAQLLAFDLNTDKLIRRIKIPTDVSQNKSGIGLLVTPIVETDGNDCESTTVFMADVDGGGLVIWNGERIFRLEASVFKPIPTSSNFSIARENFVLTDGLSGMALSPKRIHHEPRMLIFRPLSSHGMHMAQTRVLTRSTVGDFVKYYSAENILPSQASAQAISSEGTVFYGLTKEIGIGCWNRYKHLAPSNMDISIIDNMRLQFISGMKIMPATFSQPEELYALSNRFQTFITGKQNFKEINFRIVKSAVAHLIAGTTCNAPKLPKTFQVDNFSDTNIY